jgi:hypothetical protein
VSENLSDTLFYFIDFTTAVFLCPRTQSF